MELDTKLPDAAFEVIKRGETHIGMTFRRSGGGLTLAVKVSPKIEEFFRNVSTGENVDVRSIGRHWYSLDKNQPLWAYNLAEPIPMIQIDGTRRARFDRLAVQLIQGPNDGGGGDRPLSLGREQEINLGFLRLVGVGESAGVTFTIRGVYSEKAVQDMRDAVADGARKFYQTYMKPINLNISIVSSEW